MNDIKKLIKSAGNMSHTARKFKFETLLNTFYEMIVSLEEKVEKLMDAPEPDIVDIKTEVEGPKMPFNSFEVSTENEEVPSPLFAELAATGDVRIYKDDEKTPFGVLVDNKYLVVDGIVEITDNGTCKEGKYGKPLPDGTLKNTSANAKINFRVLKRVSKNVVKIKL